MKSDDKELMWLDLLQNDISEIPFDESKFIEMMLPLLNDMIIPTEYGL